MTQNMHNYSKKEQWRQSEEILYGSNTKNLLQI